MTIERLDAQLERGIITTTEWQRLSRSIRHPDPGTAIERVLRDYPGHASVSIDIQYADYVTAGFVTTFPDGARFLLERIATHYEWRPIRD